MKTGAVSECKDKAKHRQEEEQLRGAEDGRAGESPGRNDSRYAVGRQGQAERERDQTSTTHIIHKLVSW